MLSKGDKVIIPANTRNDVLTDDLIEIRDSSVTGTVIARVSKSTVQVYFPSGPMWDASSGTFFDHELTISN